MPKATPNNNKFHESDTDVGFVKPKSEAISELGYSERQAQRYQQISDHPEAVEEAKKEAS